MLILPARLKRTPPLRIKKAPHDGARGFPTASKVRPLRACNLGIEIREHAGRIVAPYPQMKPV